jgi:hypothetical protein
MSTILIYTKGTAVRFSATFSQDPTTLALKLTDPSGTTTTYTYGQDDEVVRTGEGTYRADIVLSTSGLWWYSWQGTGAAAVVDQNCIFVNDLQVGEGT